MRELVSILSRDLDVLFINAPDDEFFWRDTLGVRIVGRFIAASGARPLPTVRRAGRQPRPRLRVLGRRGRPTRLSNPPCLKGPSDFR